MTDKPSPLTVAEVEQMERDLSALYGAHDSGTMVVPRSVSPARLIADWRRMREALESIAEGRSVAFPHGELPAGTL